MTVNDGAFEIPDGFWQREASHFPKPLTMMGSDVLLDAMNQAFPPVFAEFGLLLDRFEFREINGYVYQAARPFGVASTGEGRTPPAPLLWLAFRLVPRFRKRIATCKRAVRDGVARSMVRLWSAEWRPQLIADIARWRAADLGAVTTTELAGHLERLKTWMYEAVVTHFRLTPANGLPLAELSFFCRDHLGYEDARVLPLLSGLSGASSEPALAMARLASLIKQDGLLARDVLAADAGSVEAVLWKHGGPAAKAFHEYREHYGFRALRYEFVDPALAEQPELLGGLLQDQLRSAADLNANQHQLEAARAAAKAEALAALPTETEREAFGSLLSNAQDAYGVREDNEFFTISVPLAVMRVALLEAGERLVATATIRDREDVFHLSWDEMIAALQGGGHRYQELVNARRKDLAVRATADPAASFGTEPPDPPLSVLPPESRLAMEAMMYMRDHVFEPVRSNSRSAADVRELRGRAAARGTYTGTARVILGEDQFGRLQAGDVLVCPITSPVWSVLFAKVGALVTDSGGILSHPAIIAREYGIPAVVATGNATQIIKDGQRVTVQGDAGVVVLTGDVSQTAG